MEFISEDSFIRYTGEGMDVLEFSEAESNIQDMMYVSTPFLHDEHLVDFPLVLNTNRLVYTLSPRTHD